MKTRARMQWAVLTCATVVFTAPAWPAGSDGSGVYIGAGAGASRTTLDDAGINAALLSLGFASATTSKSETSAAYKAFIGYSFNEYIAIEGGYFNLGKFKFDSAVTPPGNLHGETSSQGFNVDAVLSYPFAQGFSVFGRAGVQNSKSRVDLTGTGSVVVLISETSETKTSWKAGLGLGYEFAQRIGVRGEWEYYRVPDGTNSSTLATVDVFGISLYYKF